MANEEIYLKINQSVRNDGYKMNLSIHDQEVVEALVCAHFDKLISRIADKRKALEAAEQALRGEQLKLDKEFGTFGIALNILLDQNKDSVSKGYQ